jgi:hypothetical protein
LAGGTVKVIVGFAAGGPTDLFARRIAQKSSEQRFVSVFPAVDLPASLAPLLILARDRRPALPRRGEPLARDERPPPASFNSTQAGAWSLAPASPRTSRSTPAAASRFAASALNSR